MERFLLLLAAVQGVLLLVVFVKVSVLEHRLHLRILAGPRGLPAPIPPQMPPYPKRKPEEQL